MQVPGEEFMVYVDYPTSRFNAQKGKPIVFNVLGDSRIGCRMMLIKTGKQKLPEVIITVNGDKKPLKGKKVADGNMEYEISGDSLIRISATFA
jgi:hypothetical protein